MTFNTDENNTPRPNFFMLLGLDPGETNPDVIAKSIDAKIKECNRIRSDAPQAKIREAQAFKIYEKDIRAILNDPVARNKQAAERREQIRVEEADLDGMIKMLKSKGSYRTLDVRTIASGLTAFDKSDVEKRIRLAGIPLEDKKSRKPAPAARPKTSAAEAQGIENDLRGLHLNSLYEYLERLVSSKSSQNQLQAAYDSKKALLDKMIRGQDEHKVNSVLLAHVKAHLLDPAKKEHYDNYLDDRALKSIDNFIKLRAGDSKLVTDDTLSEIVRAARIPNVTAERTAQYVKEWVEQTSGWTLAISSGYSLVSLLMCGHCGKLSGSETQRKCDNCGESLRIPCPNRNCGADVATESTCCPECGCTTGDAPFVETLIREANGHLQHDDEKSLTAATTAARKVLDVWPNYQIALDILESVKRVRQQQRDAKHDRQKKEKANLNRLSELVSSRRLFEADRFVEQLKVDGQSIRPATLQMISRGLNEAMALRKAATALLSSGRNDEAIVKFHEAIVICDDDLAARDAVNAIPPLSPTDVTVERMATHNRITWQVSRHKIDAKYVVLRKQDGLPVGKNDGMNIAQVTGESFDDTTAVDGCVYYYAVYAVRGKVFSTHAATSEAVLRPGGLQDLAATATEGEVCVTWKLPNGSRQVRLTRQPGALTKTIVGGEFSERGLEVGQVYTYTVVPLYNHPQTGQNGAVRGAKRTVEVVVSQKPTAVTDLSAGIKGKRIKIAWTPPAVGIVQIRLSPRKPALQASEIIGAAEAEKIGERLRNIGDGEAIANLPTSGQVHVVPVTVEGSTAIIGKWASVTKLPEVTNLRARPTTPGRIELTWDWPEGIETVRATMIRAIDRKTLSTAEVTLGRYRRSNNVCTLTYAKAQVYTIVISTKASEGNFFSSGKSVTAALGEEIRIRYRVISKKKGWFSANESKIELEWDRSVVMSLTNLAVVGRPDRLPTSISDGETIATFDEVLLNGDDHDLQIPESDTKIVGKLYLKLFLHDPSRHPLVRLVPARKNELILS